MNSRRRLRASFFFLILLLGPFSAFAQMVPLAFWQGPPAVKWVQKAENFTNGTTNTLQTAAFTSAPTSGNLIVCDIQYGGATANVQSVTDTNGNTYASALDVAGARFGDRLAIYYKENIVGGGGANTVKVTMTLTGTRTYLEIGCHEFSGVPSSGTLDNTGSGGTGTYSSSITTGPIASTHTNEFIFAHMAAANTGGSGTGYTSISTLNGNSTEFMAVRWPASINVLFTQSPAEGWEAVFATFRSR